MNATSDTLWSTRRPGRDESGSTLLLILVFLTSIGLLGAALMSYELTLNKQSFSTRRIQTRETGVNTAMEWAVNAVGNGREGFCQGGYDRDLLTIGGREVEVVCRVDNPDARAANNVALFLNRAEPAELNRIVANGTLGPSGTTHIDGPVYFGAKPAWSIDTPVRVAGDVLVGSDDGGCRTNETMELPKNLDALYPTARVCTTELSAVTPPPVEPPCEALEKCVDPTPLSLDAAGKETNGVPACKVFSPGLYRTAPILAGNNYFTTGTYYFELEDEWRIASAIRGGDPSPASDVAAESERETTVPRCAGAPEPIAPYGVTFVFGGRSSIRGMNSARIELFPATTGGSTLPTIVAGGRERVTDWAKRSEFGLDRDLITVGGGAPEFVLHGGVFAPDSAISLAGTREATVTIGGTVVVGRIELRGEEGEAATDAPTEPATEAATEATGRASMVKNNIGIFVPSGTAKKFVLMARSCPGGRDVISPTACTNPPVGAREPELCAVASATIYNDERRTLFVDSWRVDRDPSPSDPFRCEIS